MSLKKNIFYFLFSILPIFGVIAQSRSDIKISKGTLRYYIHTIQKNETLGGIALAYNLKIKDIEEVNPDLTDREKIKTGQKILVPNYSGFINQYPIKEWEFIFYKVQDGDKLKALAKKYGSDVKDIKNINPAIENKPKGGSEIRIPVKRKNIAVIESPQKEKKEEKKELKKENPAIKFDWGTEEAKNSIQENPKNNCKEFEYNLKKDKFNVSLALPLFLNENKKDYTGVSFLEGALLAIEDLKKEGFSANINIYDVGSKEALNACIANKKLEESNIVIGPFSLATLKTLALYAKKNKLPLVIPYESKAAELVNKNPYVIQIYPSDDDIYKKMTSADFETRINPILIYSAKPDSIMLNNYKKALKEKFGSYKEYTHVMGQRMEASNLKSILVKDIPNILYICSNNEAFISDLMDRLIVLKVAKFPLSIYGRSNWRNFRIIDPARYFDLNLHLVQPFYVDYNNQSVKDFIKRYRLSYNNEPTQYAFQGYDVTYYFLSALKRYGPEFLNCLSDYTSVMLQSRYSFRRIGDDNGYINTESFLLKYTSDIEIDIE